MQTPKHSSRARRGLSLVEATISMVIVSVVIAGALRVHAAASTNALAATRALQGRSLARTLLDEIRQCRYEEPESDATPAFGLEGEATAMYIRRHLSRQDLRVTHLARGLPVGGSLEYTDETTLSRAFQGRQEL